MTASRSVNEVLDNLVALGGQPVELEGILEVHPEGYELRHYPKSERRGEVEAGGASYQPAFWVAFGAGSLRPNRQALARWVGKRVRIHGVVEAPSAPEASGLLGGFGPYGCWLAAIEPYSIQRVTAEDRRDERR